MLSPGIYQISHNFHRKREMEFGINSYHKLQNFFFSKQISSFVSVLADSLHFLYIQSMSLGFDDLLLTLMKFILVWSQDSAEIK